MQRKTTTVIRVCVCVFLLSFETNPLEYTRSFSFVLLPVEISFVKREKKSTLIIIDPLFAEKTTQLEDHKMLYHIVVFDR